MKEMASLKAVVHGRVQGVFFRSTTSRKGKELRLTGYVQNLPDRRSVEVQAEGEKNDLIKLVNYLRAGPPEAEVERVDTTWGEYSGKYSSFSTKY